MEGADGKGRVGVPLMRPGFLVSRMIMMNVEMDMALAVMLVFMRMDIMLERPAQRPETDAKQHHADNAIAPR